MMGGGRRVVVDGCLGGAVMLLSCESSECETVSKSECLSPLKKAAVLERSQVLSEGGCVEDRRAFGAPCSLKSFVVIFSSAKGRDSDLGMAPQRLTSTVILPIERGMVMKVVSFE